MKKLILKAFTVLFLASVITNLNNCAYSISTPSDTDSNPSYNQAVTMDKPVVVKFYADWCGACQQVAPILNGLKSEYASKFNFVNLNIDKQDNYTLSDKFNVKTLPSIFIVNPKTGDAKFLNQNNYFNSETLKKEFDDYLKNCLQ